MNIQKINAHLESYKDNPALQRVMVGESTLVGELREFYGFSGRGKSFKVAEGDPEKQGQLPSELVDLVDGFYENPIDRSHLEYEEVRQGVVMDRKKPNRTDLRSLATGAIAFGATLGTTYLLQKIGVNLEGFELPVLALGIASPFLGVIGYNLLSPRLKAEKRSRKQLEAVMRGAKILEEDEGRYSLASINSTALRERAKQVDGLLALKLE